MIGVGEARDGVYWLCTDVINTTRVAAVSASSSGLWHQHLGHPVYPLVLNLPGLNIVCTHTVEPCSVYLQSKQTRDCFSSSSNKANDLFELIHADVWGQYRVSSTCGARYFLTLVDDFSQCVWVHLLSSKSEVDMLVRNFCAFASTQFHKQVKRFRPDNGTEFLPLRPFFDSARVLFETSCVATP